MVLCTFSVGSVAVANILMSASLLSFAVSLNRSTASSWALLIMSLYSSSKFLALALFRSSRSEEHTSELRSLMRISYAVFCLKKKKAKYERQVSEHVTRYTRNRHYMDYQ